MTINATLLNHGSAGGTPINVDVSRLEHGAPVKVLLSANYTLASTPNFPTRPGFTGAAAASLDYPRVIPSGTTITLLKGEADALVTAGKASYA